MKLMLADDHPLFLEGLCYLLGTYGIEVAGTAKDGMEALAKAREIQPDMILMDIRMPRLSGIDALRLIKAEMPGVKIVMLTTSEEDRDLFDAVKYGASGYLLKSADAEELVNTLKDLESGGNPLSTGLAAKILEEFGYAKARENKSMPGVSGKAGKDKLTPRQLEILKMVAGGVTYREAGEALGISERTLKYHMSRIIELLHLENRAQAIAYASRTGLVDLSGKEQGKH